MSSGFTKTFRLIALGLLVSVMQVYVLAHPRTMSSTATTTDTGSVTKPVTTDHQVNFIKQNQVTSPTQLSSERSIKLAPKSPLSLVFNRAGVERAAATTAFLKVTKGAYDPLMMKPKGQQSSGGTQTDTGSDDNGSDRKALYIASAIVIGAAVAAFIGFRHDRDDDDIRGQ